MEDILADLPKFERHTGSICQVKQLRDKSPEMASQFDRALSSKYSAEAISRWFREREVPISGQVVRNHRAGVCLTCRKT